MMRSKIHRATVTAADLDYEGVPEDRLAGHRPRIVLVNERNQVESSSSINLVNGARPVESREPVVQGAAR